MEQRKSVIMLTGLILFILLLLFSWYVRIGKVTEKVVKSTTELALDHYNSKGDINRVYFMEKEYLIKKQRSYIPFVYKVDTLMEGKTKYYDKPRNWCNCSPE